MNQQDDSNTINNYKAIDSVPLVSRIQVFETDNLKLNVELPNESNFKSSKIIFNKSIPGMEKILKLSEFFSYEGSYVSTWQDVPLIFV